MHVRMVGILAVVAMAALAAACTTKTTVLPPSQEAEGINVSGRGGALARRRG